MPIGEPVFTAALRLLDVATGIDQPITEAVGEPAWASDERLGYLQYVSDWTGTTGPGGLSAARVLVQDSLDAAPIIWTTAPGYYFGLAWAGDQLVAQVSRPGRYGLEGPDLVVLDGPDSIRVIARDAALVALSPDGTQVLVRTVNNVARLFRVADGIELAQLRMPSLIDLGRGGVWRENRVITRGVSASGEAMRFPPAVIEFTVDGSRLAVRQVGYIAGRGDESSYWANFSSVTQPRGIEAGTGKFGAWFWRGTNSGHIECDFGIQRCVFDARYSHGQFVENPSRP